MKVDVARVDRPAAEQEQADDQCGPGAAVQRSFSGRSTGVLRPPAARPAARPVAKAQEKLWPPIGPNASSISPQRYSPATRLLSRVLGSTSPRATPPPVTSAFL